ncbi:hypothetical protein B296_00029869 [Ensete ventricosum]|uniref:Uncharacterized protein n=1 Tax=Ensete ventricosum TaxID=4639 RepID=A0A427AK42_ENSVE|nr:hypothetical protein B296_00029869 [Ensete ventricosum]
MVNSGSDSLVICRVLKRNVADQSWVGQREPHGPAEDLYGIFVNVVRRERPPELLEEIRGLVTFLYGSLCNFYSNVKHYVVDMRPQQRMAELCQLKGVKLIVCSSEIFKVKTVMGGLLSEKFLKANLSLPFVGPPLNTPSLQKYKRVCCAYIVPSSHFTFENCGLFTSSWMHSLSNLTDG